MFDPGQSGKDYTRGALLQSSPFKPTSLFLFEAGANVTFIYISNTRDSTSGYVR
jgi:hypothetical protein